ncbi:hypothetical protein FA95DRAFT_1681000 [Auriscalpium vulgare]|uniref:Uncharacterized protein n=1 Tax=Auriscalpium vulgare TaxID=40419 RepID=A0ACB8RLN3_9AGAM|nr:hypothetical protein FA95DRAFT_1681000 [Auriscalpium vulgare]
MIPPMEVIKALSALAEVVTVVANTFSTTKLQEVAAKDQVYMKALLDECGSLLDEDMAHDVGMVLEVVEQQRLKITAKKRSRLRTYIVVRKYQKVTRSARSFVQVASDGTALKQMQIDLKAKKTKNVQAHVQSAQKPEPSQGAPDHDRVNLSLVLPSGAPSNGPDVAMQATVNGDPEHVYIASYFKEETLELRDPATGKLVPLLRYKAVNGVKGGRDGSGAAKTAATTVQNVPGVGRFALAEEAATSHTPNTPNSPETDASMDNADTSDGVSSDASSDGPSFDTPDVSSTFNGDIERVDLDGLQQVAAYLVENPSADESQ